MSTTPDTTPPDASVSTKGRHVLVVEDERHIRDLVCLHLGLEGCICDGVGDGPEALRRVREHAYDLVVLDLMLPGVDGVTVCRAIRREPLNLDVPILMLTARREEADKVLGLESGADDYLTKPFGIRELVARARALMRRPRQPGVWAGIDRTASLSVHGITIDPARRRVTARGQEVELTAQEFSLLHLLASHPGIVFSRDALLTRIWKGDVHVTERSVDTLVKRLRRKIEVEPAEPTMVLTVWGTGYKFADV